MTREIEDVVAEMFPHTAMKPYYSEDGRYALGVYAEIPACVEGKCVCGASGKRARMLAAIQMHVDRKTGGRVYLDRP